MPVELKDLATPPWAEFDTIIDVRSPAEYAEDHIPGAISLPVLSNEERAEVGTIYVQDSPFRARKIGAALVARNAARHIEERLMGFDGGWRPLVYCWRGGQRSGSFASILSQIGWRAETLSGGYRSYRRAVVDLLYGPTLPHRVFRLDGYTGTAKTEILGLLAARGVQVIDLEGLARHRGSALGDRPGGQPAQKAFETHLAQRIIGLDPARPLVVEAESARIGALRVPPALWTAMRDAPRLVVEAPVPARAAYLARAYADLAADHVALSARLDLLRPLVGHEVVEAWRALSEAGETEALARELVERHYDPAYGRLRQRDPGPVAERFGTGTLDPEALGALADRIAGWLSSGS
ncbi:tRNA 2-selenouridine(34) synthase MnmH [Rhodobacterales bacterium HKCCE3408]|nr:tRNA 2-selenouridine(34) synthase MnmH [Rhodobacterales bacterium HKCCE3408]